MFHFIWAYNPENPLFQEARKSMRKRSFWVKKNRAKTNLDRKKDCFKGEHPRKGEYIAELRSYETGGLEYIVECPSELC